MSQKSRILKKSKKNQDKQIVITYKFLWMLFFVVGHQKKSTEIPSRLLLPNDPPIGLW